jgi:hypothetical protein
MAWAENAQAEVGRLAAPVYLGRLGKLSLRELTDVEATAFEDYKFHVLCRLEPGSAVDAAAVAGASAGDLSLPTPVAELMRATVSRHASENRPRADPGPAPPLPRGAYALWKGDYGEDS